MHRSRIGFEQKSVASLRADLAEATTFIRDVSLYSYHREFAARARAVLAKLEGREAGAP